MPMKMTCMSVWKDKGKEGRKSRGKGGKQTHVGTDDEQLKGPQTGAVLSKPALVSSFGHFVYGSSAAC